ncbi:MAG: hemin ABC transporter substrate-binding protein [Sphingomonas sp.]|nr:MAG: hemin ABC transporter substrate-binding protein [Sphingomonas sp.]
MNRLLKPLALMAFALWGVAAQAADRIVSIGSDVTEIVFALGEGGKIVAVDDTSMYPAQTAKLPKLGYMRQLAPEPVLAQRPDLLLVSAGSGPEAVLRQLERSGLKLVSVPDEASAAGVAAKIRTVAAALGKAAEGEKLAASVIARLPKTQPDKGPSMMLVLASAPGRIMVAGQGTAGDSFIRLSGGRNSFTADGYKPLSAEAAIAAAPEVLLVPSHILGMAGGLEALEKDPVLARTPAVRNGKVFVVDSLMALNFGPRLPDAVAKLRDGLGLSK